MMRPIRIEIIEDESDIRDLLKEEIRHHFPQAEIHAGESCANLKSAPDILVTDYLMRGTTGTAQCAQCLVVGHRPRVIVFSGFRDEIEPDVENLKSMGLIAKAIQKPFTLEVIEEIKSIIEELEDDWEEI